MSTDPFYALAAAELERERQREMERRTAERAATLRHRGKLNASGQNLPADVEVCHQQMTEAAAQYGKAVGNSADILLGKLHDLETRLKLLTELQKGN
jgi:hypothetical protein